MNLYCGSLLINTRKCLTAAAAALCRSNAVIDLCYAAPRAMNEALRFYVQSTSEAMKKHYTYIHVLYISRSQL